MDARAIGEAELIEGARCRSMPELAHASLAADKVFVF